MGLPDRFPVGSLLGQVVRLPLKLIPDGTPLPVLSGPNRGYRFIKGYGPASYWFGIAERALQRVSKANICSGDTVYDIGANVGLHTLFFSRLVGETGHVFAFEPDPNTARKLAEHLILNHVQNVTIIEKAVTCRTERRWFSIHADPCQSHLANDGEIAVSATTLDELIKELRPPNCIKMDIEGGELEALAGGHECFTLYKPKLFLATHFGSHVQCCEILHSWNYRTEFFEDLDLFAAHI
jgi:FkbM family methyltransferase